MNKYYDAKINEQTEKLRRDVISLINQVLDELSEDIDLFLERMSVLSGMTRERLDDIIKENLDEELSVKEAHALCNAVYFYFTSIQDEENDSFFDDITDRSISIIETWVGAMNNIFDRSKAIFGELITASCAESLEEFFSTYHFFVDTSALCDENMSETIGVVIPEIKKASNHLKITVPKTVVECILEMARDEDKKRLFRADVGIYNLELLQKEGLLSIRGDNSDTTVMSTFLSAFSRFKPIYKMVLITQDEVLAGAVKMLNTSGIEGEDIIICKLSDENLLSLWDQEKRDMFQSNSLTDEEHSMDLHLENNNDLKPTDDDTVIPIENESINETPEPEDEIDISGEQNDLETINEIESDIEIVSSLDEILNNLLGTHASEGADEDENDDEGLSDEDDFDEDESDGIIPDATKISPSKEKKDIDLDFSEYDTLVADTSEESSWDTLE